MLLKVELAHLFERAGASESKELVEQLEYELGIIDVGRFKTFFDHFPIRTCFEQQPQWTWKGILFSSMQKAPEDAPTPARTDRTSQPPLAGRERRNRGAWERGRKGAGGAVPNA